MQITIVHGPLWTIRTCGPISAGGVSLWGVELGVDWGVDSPVCLKLKSLGAEADELDILLQVAKRRVIVPTHANVIREGDTARQLRILLAGTACSCKRQEDGGRSILSFLHPGDFCDLHRYVLPGLDVAVGIRALTDCTVAVIDYRDMDELRSRPTLASSLWRASMLEAAVNRERLSRTGRGTALERAAHLLCEQLARRKAVGVHDPRLPFSQIDVADAAGLSVVHVNRTIQTLRALNVLSKVRNAIEVADRKQLEEIAGFDGRYLDMPKNASKWAVHIDPERAS